MVKALGPRRARRRGSARAPSSCGTRTSGRPGPGGVRPGDRAAAEPRHARGARGRRGPAQERARSRPVTWCGRLPAHPAGRPGARVRLGPRRAAPGARRVRPGRARARRAGELAAGRAVLAARGRRRRRRLRGVERTVDRTRRHRAAGPARRRPRGRTRPDRGPGRPDRSRQDHAGRPAGPAAATRRAARCCSTASTCATATRRPRAHVALVPSRLRLRGHRARQHHPRRRRRPGGPRRRRGLGGAAAGPGRRRASPRCRTGWTRCSGERGANLSGGQRQRIAIARALVRRPRGCSCWTTRPARWTRRSSRRSWPGCARAVARAGRRWSLVAYRMATVALADEVVYLERGRVVDRGTHAELLARNEGYRELATAYEREAAGAAGADDERAPTGGDARGRPGTSARLGERPRVLADAPPRAELSPELAAAESPCCSRCSPRPAGSSCRSRCSRPSTPASRPPAGRTCAGSELSVPAPRSAWWSTGVCSACRQRAALPVHRGRPGGLRVKAFRHVHDLSVLTQNTERRGSLVSRVTSRRRHDLAVRAVGRHAARLRSLQIAVATC